MATLLLAVLLATRASGFQLPTSSFRPYTSLRSSSAEITKNDVFDADKAEANLARSKAQEERRKRALSSHGKSEKDDPEWKFFDTARLHVSGGDGGNGCVAFRREKGAPLGGPSGGRGGAGGNVYLVCDRGINTLAPLRNRVHVRAETARNGIGKDRDGQKGNHAYIPVPPGTLVRDLKTQRIAGELREHGETLLVARGGRGGRGNAAFETTRNTSPRLAERGEPGAKRWLSVELRLVADVGFLGLPNAGKSTLLAAASNARPKIADYPFTTIVPNLGVCDIGDEGAGLVLCDIPGLIKGASSGAGLGPSFLRHVQRCKVLLHVIDGTSADPIKDFHTINKELELYDEFLAKKPQVVVLNKIDVTEVAEMQDDILEALKEAAGHSRVLPISGATTENVKELMGRLKKFAMSQPAAALPPAPEIDFSVHDLEYDSDDFEIQSDPAYPGQWRISGTYIEQIARMTHWEYPEAVERFGRQMEALGISEQLTQRGAAEGDLVMVDEFDFEFSPGLSNFYIPPELLQADLEHAAGGAKTVVKSEDRAWRPYDKGGYLDVDSEELVGFSDSGDWDLLDDEDYDEDGEFISFEGDEEWIS
jgi:GTPase